jgi:hypothetical protein
LQKSALNFIQSLEAAGKISGFAKSNLFAILHSGCALKEELCKKLLLRCIFNATHIAICGATKAVGQLG